MEEDWADALRPGSGVSADVKKVYKPDNTGLRPDGHRVEWTIDGTTYRRYFPNG